ncbi:MAG: hypothetical protein LBG47_02870 [Prevotellaceae bacterium]|jgi:hypothetical protein|nr:hypothetical protein [Prevotellaceae bacterium]
MKNFLFLPIIIPALLLTACGKDEPAGKSATAVTDGTYSGAMHVTQNDSAGTVYTQDSVNVTFTPTADSTAEIKMVQVRFSPRMPIKLDMTIPGVTAVKTSEGLALSGDSIVPLAMGGEYPVYTITGMTGTATPQTLSFELLCGAYPLTFSGKRQPVE